MINNLSARTLLDLLSEKHSKDIFVSECKVGCSYIGAPRLDAWVMKPSWSNPLAIGYEIKVSRHDFFNDEKWRSYLPYCNEFYFVCPPKTILVDEVPENTGLLYSSSTGTRLFTKKKAKYRDIEIPNDIFRYILMSRTRIRPEFSNKKGTQVAYWRKWLQEKKEKTEIGCRVSTRIREIVEERIDKVERENKRLKERMESYDGIIKIIEELGEDPKDSYWISYRIEECIKELQEKIPRRLRDQIKHVAAQLVELDKMLDESENKINKEKV